MPARSRDIAQAVSDAINTSSAADTYSISVKATRSWVPVWDLPGLDNSMLCTVAPTNDLTWDLHSRSHYLKTYPIDVAFGRHLSTDENSDTDKYIDVVEEVADDMRRKVLTLSDSQATTCQAVEFRQLFGFDMKNEANVFLSMLRFTFRIVE